MFIKPLELFDIDFSFFLSKDVYIDRVFKFIIDGFFNIWYTPHLFFFIKLFHLMLNEKSIHLNSRGRRRKEKLNN